jgi:sporulation protein YlmC with PRC-barrel domain
MYGHMSMWGYPLVEVRETENDTKVKRKKHANDKPHLRSTQEVTGYDIHATDGDIGEVEDFIIDDVSWKIHFLIVETGNWFSGKKVIISPRWIKDVGRSRQLLLIIKGRSENSPNMILHNR